MSEREAFEAWWKTVPIHRPLAHLDAWAAWNARAAIEAQPAEPVTKEMWRNLAESQAELLRMQNGQAQPAERKPLEISEDDAFNLAKHVYAHTQPYDAPQILLTGKELKAIIEAAAHGIGD